MEWNQPFVILRPTENGMLEEVFQAGDMKKARYWLTYIAEIGDVCCRTPAHPKHSGSDSKPEYWKHKVASGETSEDKEVWEKLCTKRNCAIIFPDAPSENPIDWEQQ